MTSRCVPRCKKLEVAREHRNTVPGRYHLSKVGCNPRWACSPESMSLEAYPLLFPKCGNLGSDTWRSAHDINAGSIQGDWSSRLPRSFHDTQVGMMKSLGCYPFARKVKSKTFVLLPQRGRESRADMFFQASRRSIVDDIVEDREKPHINRAHRPIV